MPTLKSSVTTSHYSVTVHAREGAMEVRTQDPDAKEVIWGWAGDYDSTKDEGAPALYGREDWDAVREAKKAGATFAQDHDPWVWHLNAVSYCSLRTSLLTGLADPKRYELSERDVELYNELLTTMDKALVQARRGGLMAFQR